uniref:C protein n=1 Tax=Respirovirus suis TaxID=3052733 RepID=A0A6M2VKH3_9MONO|nr:C protein [Respirovirus suis]
MPSFLKNLWRIRRRDTQQPAHSPVQSDSLTSSLPVSPQTLEKTENTYVSPSQLGENQKQARPPRVQSVKKTQEQKGKIMDKVKRVEFLGSQTSLKQKFLLEKLIAQIHHGGLGEEVVQTLYLRIWAMDPTPMATKLLEMEEETRDKVLKLKLERWIRVLIRGEKTKLRDFQKRYEEVHPYLMTEKVEEIIMEEAWSLSAHIIQE